MESQTTKPRHVVCFTFPFGSQPRSLFFFVLKLAKAAPQVSFSFFNFPKSNESLLTETQTSIPLNFKTYPLDDGVPVGGIVFSGRPHEAADIFLKSAPGSMRRGIDMVVADTGVDVTCFITDGLLTFSGDIAQEYNAAWIPIWLPVPCCLSANFYSNSIMKLCSDDSICDHEQVLQTIPGLSKIQIKDLPDEVLTPNDGKEPYLFHIINQISKASHQASAIVMNSFEELNPESLNNDMRSKFRNYLNVGLLTMSKRPEAHSSAKDLFVWLDKQARKSVAYISFGTEVSMAPPPHELEEVAEAIEATGIPFIWSLRDNFKQHLPSGFIERTVKQGKIVPWAPQALVLAHNSLAVFITHFGWNSACESISCGVPLIGRPIFAEQRLVGRTMEDVLRTGVIVDGEKLRKNGLIKKLEFVMGSEEGKKLRQNAEAYKEVMLKALSPDGSATKNFNKLVEIIKSQP